MKNPKEIKEKIKKCLYQRMDSFLVEGDKPRPISQLNLDRHLFVDTTTDELLELFAYKKQKWLENFIRQLLADPKKELSKQMADGENLNEMAMKLPKQIINNKCLICEYPISSMRYSDCNGQVWCPKCGLTYQIIGNRFKEEYLKSIGKTEKDVKVPYCDVEKMIPLIKKYFEKTGKSIPKNFYDNQRTITYHLPRINKKKLYFWERL